MEIGDLWREWGQRGGGGVWGGGLAFWTLMLRATMDPEVGPGCCKSGDWLLSSS